MPSCKSCCIAVILALLLFDPAKFQATCNKTGGVWEDARKMTGLLLHNCLRLSTARSPEQFLIILQDCLKRRSLRALDRLVGRDVIKLADDVALIRYQKEGDTAVGRALDSSINASRFDDGQEEEEDWKFLAAEKLKQLFRTHVLKIHLRGLSGPRTTAFEGRRRHKHNMMSQLLMFALLAAGVIVIPMGFQFLAILGGKALLLAKMALLMTSIQGLKKIATSNLNYGLYSTYGHGPCKDDSLSYGCDPLGRGDDVFVSVDIENLSHRQYDRQWPYEAEGHVDTYANGYDGIHHYDNLHPRQDMT